MKPQVLAVIPARYGSTRLPAKALKLIGGVPMIQRVHERVKLMKTAGRVIVATDDERIAKVIRDAGGEAMLTSPDHPSGTDRVAEVAEKVPADIIVNVQGDEPFIDPAAVDMAVEALLGDPSLDVSTLCVAIGAREAADLNVTCVVRDLKGHALYFSKLPIPHDRDGNAKSRPLFKHLGTYVFRRDFLLYYAKLGPTPLEKCEKLEQLRILEHGHRIMCVETKSDSLGVDSPEDLSRAETIAKHGSGS
ncbi:MAG: 3-deoxy-manno-octulosonate cytidylyltransferase [Nitrospinae bacterium]|nr:3-deoxy-manno-octulosonate cytidylyltransferase [Nitrospinota bacterium]